MCKCSQMCQNFKRKAKTKTKAKSNGSIAEELGIYDLYPSYEEISAAHLAWITIKAKQRNLNPIMVHAGIKARYARIRNVIYGC